VLQISIPIGDHGFAVGLMQNARPVKIYWPKERLVFLLQDGAVRYEWRVRTHVTATRIR